MSDSTGAFVWYELMTTDIAAAKTFYGNVIGWKYQDMPMPDMIYTVAEAAGTGVGGMMPAPKVALDAGMSPHWTGYLYAADVDAAAAQLEKLGGTVHRPPTDIPTVGRFAVVSDPQGAAFQLFKPGQAGERASAHTPGHIGWHELHTTDWPKAVEFYGDLFGWAKGRSIDMGPMGTYQLFTIKGAEAGGMMNSPAATPRCFWLYYFIVDDIDTAAARIAASGGQVRHGPHEVPGGSWVIQAQDPQGAWFALVGPKK